MEYLKGLNDLSEKYHQFAKNKGFWDDKREIGTLLMLIVSELSEALEADRKNNHANIRNYVDFIRDFNRDDFDKESFELHIKDTFEDEIADVFIRLFDLVGYLGIDISEHIHLKMLYNQTRPYKHGKKY